jgi:hypothetical protein
LKKPTTAKVKAKVTAKAPRCALAGRRVLIDGKNLRSKK